MSKNTGRNFAIGAIIAAGVGYVAGLLTAPKSGKETREDLQKTAKNVKATAEKTLKTLSSDLSTLITDAKAMGKEAGAAARSGLDDAIARAEKSRVRVREVISAIHEGAVDDKDLKVAIEEAKKAIAHLKKFVDKTKHNVKAA